MPTWDKSAYVPISDRNGPPKEASVDVRSGVIRGVRPRRAKEIASNVCPRFASTDRSADQVLHFSDGLLHPDHQGTGDNTVADVQLAHILQSGDR